MSQPRLWGKGSLGLLFKKLTISLGMAAWFSSRMSRHELKQRHALARAKRSLDHVILHEETYCQIHALQSTSLGFTLMRESKFTVYGLVAGMMQVKERYIIFAEGGILASRAKYFERVALT
jgi:hypothetical protein